MAFRRRRYRRTFRRGARRRFWRRRTYGVKRRFGMRRKKVSLRRRKVVGNHYNWFKNRKRGRLPMSKWPGKRESNKEWKSDVFEFAAGAFNIPVGLGWRIISQGITPVLGQGASAHGRIGNRINIKMYRFLFQMNYALFGFSFLGGPVWGLVYRLPTGATPLQTDELFQLDSTNIPIGEPWKPLFRKFGTINSRAEILAVRRFDDRRYRPKMILQDFGAGGLQTAPINDVMYVDWKVRVNKQVDFQNDGNTSPIAFGDIYIAFLAMNPNAGSPYVVCRPFTIRPGICMYAWCYFTDA